MIERVATKTKTMDPSTTKSVSVQEGGSSRPPVSTAVSVAGKAGNSPDASSQPNHKAKLGGLPVVLSEAKMLLNQSSVIGTSLLPATLAYEISRRIGRMRYQRRRGSSRELTNEIKLALGLSEQQAEKWVERVYELAAWRDIELWRAPRLNDAQMQKLVEFRGLEHLKNALARGKGAILCTGHLRSLITFFVALSRKGYKINAVRRSALKVQGPVGRWLVKQRTLVGNANMNFFWMNSSNLKAAVQVGNALRRNEIVVFLIDVRYGAETVPVNFLGEEKQFPSGHILMSQATGAPLLDFYMYHPDESFRQVAEFNEPFYPTNDLVAGVQRTFSSLESKVREYPADWMWFPERELWKNPNG